MDLDFSKSKQYTLSIRLGSDGFSFYVYNPLDYDTSINLFREVDIKKSFVSNIHTAFQSIDFIGNNFKKVNVYVQSDKAMVLPSVDFSVVEAEKSFNALYSHTDGVVRYDLLSNLPIAVVYKKDPDIIDAISEYIHDCNIVSDISAQIELFSIKSRFGNNRKMYVVAHEDYMNVLCFERGRLNFFNNFRCNNNNDRVYFIMYVWKQFSYIQEKDELNISGSFSEKQEFISLIKDFILQTTVSVEDYIELKAMTQ